MKLLVTRTDRLGDVVLSLPTIDAIAAAHPDWDLDVLVAPAAVPLLEHHPAVRRIWTWSARGGAAATVALAGALRREGFAAVLQLQYRWRLGLLMRSVGIPRRGGPLSQWTSWLLLNRGVRQARSRGDAHETELGGDLARRLLAEDLPALAPPRLHLSAEQHAAGRAFRAERAPGADVVGFVHPGSGGSALDWAPHHFARVANNLAARPGWRVFVTGAGRDAEKVAAVSRHLDPGVTVLLDATDLRGFLGLLAAGDAFVGPSTGPLHMAAALDLATVGLYPPVRTLGPNRWGPRGRWVRTLVPERECPARRHCRVADCVHWNCLDLIAPEAVTETLVALTGKRSRASVTQVTPDKEDST